MKVRRSIFQSHTFFPLFLPFFSFFSYFSFSFLSFLFSLRFDLISHGWNEEEMEGGGGVEEAPVQRKRRGMGIEYKDFDIFINSDFVFTNLTVNFVYEVELAGKSILAHIGPFLAWTYP